MSWSIRTGLILLVAGMPLAAAPAAAQQAATPAIAATPLDYATLVEPEDRLEIWADPYRKRLAADAEDGAARLALMRLHGRFGEMEGVERLADEALARHPGDETTFLAKMAVASWRVQEASIFGKVDRAAEMVTLCEQRLALNPDSSAALQCLAGFHSTVPESFGGDRAKGEQALQRLQAADPAAYHLFLANRAEREEQTDLVRTHLDQAMPLLRTPREALRLATMRIALGDGPGAHAALDKAFALGWDDPILLFRRGEAAAVTGDRLEEGRQALLTLLAGSTWSSGTDHRPAAHWRLGLIAERQGDPALAEAAYRRALTHDRGFDEAKEALTALKKRKP